MSSSGSSFDPTKQVEQFRSLYGTISNALVSGVGGVISSFFLGMASIVAAIALMIYGPLNAMANGIADFMTGLVGGAADIIEQGVETTVTSIAPGATWAIGPLTFGLSILAMGAGLWALAWILGRAETSDTIPFTFTDIPFVGVDEEEEGEGT